MYINVAQVAQRVICRISTKQEELKSWPQNGEVVGWWRWEFRDGLLLKHGIREYMLRTIRIIISCAGGHQNMPHPLQVDLWPFDLESGVRVTCNVGYLCANFNLPIGLSILDLGPMYAIDRQTDFRQTEVRRASSLNAPYLGAGHNNPYLVYALIHSNRLHCSIYFHLFSSRM